MTITKYIVARTANEASRFWNSQLCHDSQNDAQEFLNRCKLLGLGRTLTTLSSDAPFTWTPSRSETESEAR
jgi:hypothetical protein